MTSDERQALREKHTAHGRYGKGTTSCDICPGYYPCDVIQLLDATEPECDHFIGKVLVIAKGLTVNQADIKFCPKCGEKL